MVICHYDKKQQSGVKMALKSHPKSKKMGVVGGLGSGFYSFLIILTEVHFRCFFGMDKVGPKSEFAIIFDTGGGRR